MPKENMDMKLRRLFVYGTLRRDVKKASPYDIGRVVGYARVYNAIMLTHKRVPSFPAVVPGNQSVVGQLIDATQVADELWRQELARLDKYEGVPHLYKREIVRVRMVTSGTETDAFMYWFNKPHGLDHMQLVPSGDWRDVVEDVRKRLQERVLIGGSE